MEKKILGRPRLYKEEYCEMLIEHMASGYSFESFGGDSRVMVARDTLYEWANTYENFSDAKKIGEVACLKFWEGISIARSNGKIKNGCAASYIFNMKNRFLWRDKVEIATEKNEIKTITLKYNLDYKQVDKNKNIVDVNTIETKDKSNERTKKEREKCRSGNKR